MPLESTNIDLTALAAEEARESQGVALPDRGRSVDVLVIDDQPDHEAGWFNRHLKGHRRLSVESVAQLERFLAGDHLPNLPPPPYCPELAMVDLSLGTGERGGLEALHRLRRHPATSKLPAILNTNGLEDHRDMLCVIAAQINGGAIAVAQKSTADGPAVRELVCRIGHANDAGLGWPLTKSTPGLAHVHEVMWHDRASQSPQSLSFVLLDLPWKRTYWLEMYRHGNHQDAANEARKRHGELAESAVNGSFLPKGERARAQDRARFVTKTFGSIAVALRLTGGRLHQINGKLCGETAEFHADYPTVSKNRGTQLGYFADRYGPVLTDPFVHSLLDAQQ